MPSAAGPARRSAATTTLDSTTAFSYDSARRPSPARAEIGELLRYRDLLKLLVSKIIKTRYKRSSLGVVWTLLNPLLHMAVLTVAFSAVFKGAVASYPVYVLTGIIWWSFFTQTTNYAMSSVVWGGGLLKRIYVPRTIFAVASVAHGVLNLFISLAALAVLMALVGHPFHATWWFMPVPILLLALFSLGVSLLMSTLAVFFVDTFDIFQVVVQAMFFLTPIIYPKEIFPPQYEVFQRMNPMAYLLETFRAPLVDGALPDASTLAVAAAAALAFLVAGWWTFTSKADELAYSL